jgi:DNA-directed RNA polymerase subunit RPC12/RpoP
MPVSYRLLYRCRNCYSWVYLDIPAKIEAPRHVTCPTCELQQCFKTDKRTAPDGEWPLIYKYNHKTEDIEIYP